MIRLGAWDSVLAGVSSVDSIICDPPFSKRTHSGTRMTRADDSRAAGLVPSYDHFTDEDVANLIASWHQRCEGWMVFLSDSVLTASYRKWAESYGRYGFAPVACVINGMSVRLMGDGPSSWTIYANVSRPRTERYKSWGTLPGAYVGGTGNAASGGRGKPHWLMRSIVADYSREGELVCDPFSGWASTALACIDLRRRFVGAEVDQDAWAKGQQRIANHPRPPT